MRDRLVAAVAAAAALPLVLPAAVGAAPASAAPSSRGSLVCTLTDPDIVESSGLADADGLLLTVNDAGDSGRVFIVDPATGDTVGERRWTPTPIDVEAVAMAPDGEAWVGDIGGNNVSRRSVEVHKMAVGRGVAAAAPETHTLDYPYGTHDAETLLVKPSTGRLFVVTKDDEAGRVFAAPVDLGETDTLVPRAAVPRMITDGAFFPDSRHIILRSYTRAYVYDWPTMDQVGWFFLPPQPQGEGLTVTPDGRVLVSSEGLFSDVLEVALPPEIRAVVEPTG